MTKPPHTFACISNSLLGVHIIFAGRHVIYAAPNLATSVADALCNLKRTNPSVEVRVIIDPDPDTLRLGFGEPGAMKRLVESGIDVRTAPGLRIGVFIVDDQAFLFSPTPEIILGQPEIGTNNAVCVNVEFAKQLLFSMAPDIAVVNEDDDLDERVINHIVEPEIGIERVTDAQLETVRLEMEKNPPKQFDTYREVLVYNGHFQFVELSMHGCMLESRTIRLPKGLWDISNDTDMRLKISASCKLFGGGGPATLLKRTKGLESKLNSIRKAFLRPLGGDRGSVILSRERGEFDKQVSALRCELELARGELEADVDEALHNGKAELADILLKLLRDTPRTDVAPLLEGCPVDERANRRLIERALDETFPATRDILREMELRCTFKDVTWETLNDPDFFAAIERQYPEENLRRLYSTRNTIAERERTAENPDPIKTDEWPETLLG